MISRLFPLALASLLWAPTGDMTGPAGVYTIVTTGPTKVSSGDGWLKLEWSEGSPGTPPPIVSPPPPTPPPAPPPSPPVDVIPISSGPAWIAAVYDPAHLSDLPDGQKALLANKTLFGQLKSQQITWSVWKADDFFQAKWGQDIAGKPLPLLLVIWSQGNRTAVYPLPRDDAGLFVMVNKMRRLQ